MNETVKNDLPFVQRACEKILEQFPEAPLRLYWWEDSDDFVIVTKNRKLFESQDYKKLRHELYDELLQQTYNGVDFIGFSLKDDDDYEPNCIEFEIKRPVANREPALRQ